MKKLIVLTMFVLFTAVIFSSCRSHGPKCPGMYNQTPVEKVEKPA